MKKYLSSHKHKSFVMADCVANDKDRPVLGCVHYEEGLSVATDTHLLVACKHQHSENMNGANVTPKGDFVDGNYPKWRCVVDTIGDTRQINFFKFKDDIQSLYEDAKATYSATALKDVAVVIDIPVGNDVVHKILSLAMLCKVMDCMDYDCDRLTLNDGTRVFQLSDSETQRCGLLMPMCSEYQPDNRYSFNDRVYQCDIKTKASMKSLMIPAVVINMNEYFI